MDLTLCSLEAADCLLAPLNVQYVERANMDLSFFAPMQAIEAIMLNEGAPTQGGGYERSFCRAGSGG